MKPSEGGMERKSGLQAPGLHEQGAIWALALLGFVVLAIGQASGRDTTPADGAHCAWPRSARLERGFTRAVTCTLQPGGSRPLQGPARWLFGQRVSLNEADARLLEALPRIGPARALAIIEERNASPFDSVEALERVRGIGPATVEAVWPFLRVDPPHGVAPRTGSASAAPHERPQPPPTAPPLTPRSAKTDGEG